MYKIGHQTISHIVRLLLLLFFLANTLLPLAAHAEATGTFTVTSTLDAVDANPGDGRCATSLALRSQCTLRAAIQEANANAGADTIILSATTYFLTIAGFDLDANANAGDLDLTDPAGVTIVGNSATIVSNYRTFHIHAAATAHFHELAIQSSPQAIFNQGKLAVTAGRIVGNERVQATQQHYPVSGIDSSGELTLTEVSLAGLIRGDEGQIVLRGSGADERTSRLERVTVENGKGIALVVAGAGNVVEVIDSTFDNNIVAMSLSGANHVTVQRSTMSHNQHGALVIGGGAIEFPLMVDLLNSTFSANRGGPAVGLLTSDSRTLALRLNNVTITDNTGNNSAGGIVIPPLIFNLPTPVTIANSIIAGNSTGGGSLAVDPNCSGTLTAPATNMIGFTPGASRCVIRGENRNETPAMEPLAANGGATQTHALTAGSSAINAGSTSLPGSAADACEPTDQTGNGRPQGTACDLGAVEMPGVLGRTLLVTSITPTSTLAAGSPISVTVQGEGFQPDTVVRRDGDQQIPTTFVSANELLATFPELVATGDNGLINITVFDPTTGQSSNRVAFELRNPAPIALSVNPQKIRTGLETLVTVTGQQLTPFTDVQINGSALEATTFISSTQLLFRVPATLAQPAGAELDVQLVTPQPGGGQAANTLKLLVVDSPGVGSGSVETNVKNPLDPSTMTLGWVHPEDWRKLTSMSVNIIDGTSNTVVAGVGFLEEYGTTGALVTLDGNGNVTGIGFPGEATMLDTPIGRLDLQASQINAAPGTTVEVVYVFQFNAAAAGRDLALAITANDQNGDDHGIEAAGTIRVPTTVFLPLVIQ